MPIPSVVTSSATCSLLIQAPCDSSRLLDAVALSWCSARWFSCVIMTRYRPRLEYSCQTDTGCFASCGGSSFGLWFQQASLCSPCWRFMVSLLWPGPSESASFFFFFHLACYLQMFTWSPPELLLLITAWGLSECVLQAQSERTPLHAVNTNHKSMAI